MTSPLTLESPGADALSAGKPINGKAEEATFRWGMWRQPDMTGCTGGKVVRARRGAASPSRGRRSATYFFISSFFLYLARPRASSRHLAFPSERNRIEDERPCGKGSSGTSTVEFDGSFFRPPHAEAGGRHQRFPALIRVGSVRGAFRHRRSGPLPKLRRS